MNPRSKQAAGFTIIEMIVIVVIIGVLSAIAAPSWLAFLTRQRLNAAQAEAIGALREAQANAKREKRTWQACFQDNGTKVRWAVRARPITGGQDSCNTVPDGLWQNLTTSDADVIAIDNTRSTAALQRPSGYYRIEFQDRGLLNKDQPLGTITFIPRGQSNSQGRCVAIDTILGAMRAGAGNECTLSPEQP